MDIKKHLEEGTGFTWKELRYLKMPPLPYFIYVDDTYATSGVDVTEIEEGKAALKILGGKLLSAEPVKLPGLDDGRAIIKIAKTKATPAQYPRKAGTPEKQPLGSK